MFLHNFILQSQGKTLVVQVETPSWSTDLPECGAWVVMRGKEYEIMRRYELNSLDVFSSFAAF